MQLCRVLLTSYSRGCVGCAVQLFVRALLVAPGAGRASWQMPDPRAGLKLQMHPKCSKMLQRASPITHVQGADELEKQAQATSFRSLASNIQVFNALKSAKRVPLNRSFLTLHSWPTNLKKSQTNPNLKPPQDWQALGSAIINRATRAQLRNLKPLRFTSSNSKLRPQAVPVLSLEVTTAQKIARQPMGTASNSDADASCSVLLLRSAHISNKDEQQWTSKE